MSRLLEHLDKLHAFITIADTGSLQGAAKPLHISQPALSLKLKTLEEAVEYQLFTRSKKGVELTQAGHNLYRFSKRVINDAELLSLLMKGEHSRMRIGAHDIITQMIARSVCSTHSFIDILFRIEGSNLALLDALEKDEIDIAIVDDPPTIPGFQYQKLARSPFSLFSTKSFKKTLPTTDAALLQSLQNAPLIYLPGGIAYEQTDTGKHRTKLLIDSFIEQLKLGRSKRIRVDSFVLGLEITMQGHGIGLLLTGHILDKLKSGALVELTHKNLRMPYSSMLYTVTKSGADQSKLAPALSDIKAVFDDAVAAFQSAKSNR